MKLGLAFSGGKDSWACLWLYERRLSEITVFWVNTGKIYPETLEQVNRAKELCPNFVEVVVNRDLRIPADVVPINFTQLGQQYTRPREVTIQSYLTCCQVNISEPLKKAVREAGVTHLIVGQRDEEGHRSELAAGTPVEGIIHILPLKEWTEEQVLEYLALKMPLPAHFAFKHSSLDCYDCTAYKKESQDRVEWMKEKHPGLYREYTYRRAQLETAIASEL